ncbi:STAS domain-containing protein [Nocardia farcinica]|uniref:STAS domain-containing protein n=1 Tax=Nocardia farcinica TaxID=37329 RepID=UPI002458D345|nr:STAS domain-containing protein [Nocardia farcinica]
MNLKSSSPFLSVNSAMASAGTPETRLVFRTRHQHDVVVLSVRGQADAFTLSLWRQRVREAAEAAAKAGGALIVDIGRIDFCSLRTIGALVEDAGAFQRDGVRTCLVTTDLRIARLLAGDSRTAPLIVRSTVVSAYTALGSTSRPAEPAVPVADSELPEPAITENEVVPTRKRFHEPSAGVSGLSSRKPVAAGARS